MAARGSLLSGFVLSAVVLTGIAAPSSAVTAAAPAKVQPPGRTPISAEQRAPSREVRTGAVPLLGMAPMVLPPASGSDGIKSGNRAAASMVTRQLTDRTAISWNPTNGNMVLAGQLLHIKGAGRDLGIGWRYNSLNDARPTLSVGATEAAVTVGADLSVTYTAPDGGTYRFAKSGPTVWTMPPGLNATITSSTSTAVSIRFNDTGYSNDYAKVGSVFRLVSENDQNAAAPNKITYTYDAAGLLSTINDTIGGRPVSFL